MARSGFVQFHESEEVRKQCSYCGARIEQVKLGDSIVAAGGWCAPSETTYDFTLPPLCSDCRAREIFLLEIGFDPGPNGENLKVNRGGIKYGGVK